MNIFPSSVEGWNTLFQAVSVILVAGTVLAGFGTIITGRIVSRRQAQALATANAEAAKANKGVADTGLEIAKAREETARLTQEAEAAKTERTEADKQIAIARADAARAREGIANAEAQSAKASVEVARLQTVVANSEQKRAEAERALLELRQKIAHRTISPVQRAHLIELLSSGPKGPVTITCVLGDGEGLAFAGQINEVLKASGWDSKGVNQAVYTGSNPTGIGIVVRDGKTAPAYAAFLQHTFGSVGIPLGGVEQKDIPEGTVMLLVGNKP